ncbi:MAG TPA: FliM/FliN family flagellar motor C-terminal domain-containing protein [Terracidiphilus sp.]
MATATQPVPPVQSQPAQPAAPAVKGTLVPSPPSRQPSIGPDSVLARLPVEVEVGVPLRNFRVRNLLALERGAVVGSQWSHGEDMPLSAGSVQLAWTQFEVFDSTLAARITRLA